MNAWNCSLRRFGYTLMAATILMAACARSASDTESQEPVSEIGPAGNAVAFVVATNRGDREVAESFMAAGTFTNTSYCGDTAFNCMREDSKAAGDLSALSSRELTRTDTTATVELQMTWSKLGLICQKFSLVWLEDEWRVDRVESPTTCTN